MADPHATDETRIDRWLADDPALAADARARIADPTNEVFVSAATVWEIAIKRSLGKVEAPVIALDGERAGSLEPHHCDPFDRMLVAQARRLDATIVTRNPVFAHYGFATLGA